MKFNGLFIITSILFFTLNAHADSGVQTDDSEANGKSLAVSDFLNSIEIPTLLGGTNSDIGSIAALIGDDGSEVSVQFNLLDTDSSYLTAKLAGPLDASEDNFTLGDLNGLRDKARITLAWQHNPVPKPNAASFELGSLVYEQQLSLCQEYASYIETKIYTEDTCTPDFFDSEFSRLDKSILERWYALNFSFEKTKYWGGDATAAHENFTFTTNENLANDLTQKETDIAARAYFGQVLSLSSLYEIGYRYEKSFQSEKETEVCTMLADSTSSCRDIAIGAPTEIKKHIAFASYRKINSNYAINVTLSHDIENDQTGIQVPIWFRKSEKGIFNGGVQVDWTSEGDEIMFSVFLNSPFKSWGN